ncbi:hypothetical protein Fcan01_28707 [Folsomia candida]|uniref:Uncharacterized protein n=1 Tax=Folsomia candida TaxID=158441 RepID=A0A226CVK3_FOLCA|nr:hypothetical protein Fcan01_28707 [Folsomia candida]
MARVHNYFANLLLLYVPTVITNSGPGILPVFEVLLNKLVICDVQIIHDVPNWGIDWGNIYLPVKIVTAMKRSYRINIFKTRAATSCKFAILISAHSLELGGFYGLGKKLDDWINTATHWHIFYYERKWQENLRCLDSVMSIVTIKPKADGQVRIYFWTGKYFKISFLLTAVDNRLKFCAWFRKRLTRKILAFFQGVKQGCDGVGENLFFLRSRSVIDIALDFEL